MPGGTAIATIDWSQVRERAGWASLPVRLELPGLADVTAAISVVRRLLDLDADPVQIAAALGGDRTLAPLLQRRPPEPHPDPIQTPSRRKTHEPGTT